MPHSLLLGSVRFVQKILGRFPASCTIPTNNSKQMEKGRELSHAFIVHCSWVAQQLCQDCHNIFFFFFLNHSFTHWNKLKVKMKWSIAMQLRSTSIWHLHYGSVEGPLQHFSLRWFISACSECSLLSNSGTTPTWPNSSFHNMARIWLDLNWASLPQVACVHSLLFHSSYSKCVVWGCCVK